MYKRDLGISVYPEHFEINETKEYLKTCYESGIKKVFMSLIHLRELSDSLLKKYTEIINFAKKTGYYIVLDINDNALKVFNVTRNSLSKFIKLGANCLRLDSPMMPKEVADSTNENNELDFQINMSSNDNFLKNIIDFKPFTPNLYGCHNFYPLKNSGLSLEFFTEASRKFVDQGIHTSAFVGSEYGDKGPQKQNVGPLVSMELLRRLPIRTQAKILFATNLISTVYVGNQPMSNEEIANFKDINKLKKIELDILMKKNVTMHETNLINYDYHFRRGDLNNNFIRSTYTRVDFRGANVKPSNTVEILNKGDVVIINNNNNNYQNEVLIILKDNFTDFGNTVNIIGKIADYDLALLDFIMAWNRFSFRKVN